MNEHINDVSNDMMKRASDINTTLEETEEKRETKAEENKEGAQEVNHEVLIEDADGEKPLNYTKSMYVQPSENQAKGQYVDIRL